LFWCVCFGYQELKAISNGYRRTQRFPAIIGQLPYNIHKNRFKDIIPCAPPLACCLTCWFACLLADLLVGLHVLASSNRFLGPNTWLTRAVDHARVSLPSTNIEGSDYINATNIPVCVFFSSHSRIPASSKQS
jgi:hypothetical protein